MVEKPAMGTQPSNLAVIGRYILAPTVMKNLNKLKQGAGGEIQLTDAIAEEIEAGRDVFGCASAASASIADPRRASCRPPSPSAWSARNCATNSPNTCITSCPRTARPSDLMTRNVLVTGGAGYIGSHACKALSQAGFVPVTLDNLTTGWRDAVKFGPLVEADLMDRAALDAAFAEYQPVAVLHFAALSQVGEAMAEPGKYWRNNVSGSLNLIEAAVAAGCMNFVFSSTCATYGDRDGEILDEDTPQAPLNAYGASKRAIEDMLVDFEASHGLRHVIFRYFNVAGADPDGEVGEFHAPKRT